MRHTTSDGGEKLLGQSELNWWHKLGFTQAWTTIAFTLLWEAGWQATDCGSGEHRSAEQIGVSIFKVLLRKERKLQVVHVATQDGNIPARSSLNKTQCTIKQYWGAFAEPLLSWKSNKYYTFGVCVCSLRYPARNAHAPYCHLWPAPLYNIFPHYLINGTIFGKKSYWTQNVCFDFLYNFCL